MTFEHTNSKGQTYYLNEKEVTLKGGRKQTIYFFSRDVRDSGINVVPDGMEITENSRTGLPILRRIK